jgi:lysophospholipase L1-like esterase
MSTGLLAVIGIALVALACAELGARWWIRQRSGCYVRAPGLRIDVQLDLETLPQLEATARFDINADGERGSDVRAGTRGLYRILVAGGSPVESFFVDQETCWPGALEELLGSPENLRALAARTVHVGSLGRAGVASQELDLILERVLPRYGHLSAILIMVGGNDVFHWLADNAPAVVRSSSVTPEDVFDWHPEQRLGWSPRQWGIVKILARLWRVWLRPRQAREGGRWIADARKMRAQAAEVRTSTSDPAGMLAHFEDHLRGIIQTAKGYSDRVVIVRQPWFEKDYTPDEAARMWHGGVGDAWKEAITIYYSLDVVNRLMGLLDTRAAEVADDMDVEHLDIRAILEPNLANYYDYVHFTAAGSAVIAQAVAAALVTRLEIPTGVRS